MFKCIKPVTKSLLSEMFLKSLLLVEPRKVLSSIVPSKLHKLDKVWLLQCRKCVTNSNECLTEDEIVDRSSVVVTEENKAEIFREITYGDPQTEKKLKIIDFEIKVFQDECANVPSELRKSDYEELLLCSSVEQRKRLLTFIFKNEKKKLNSIKKKEVLMEKRKEAFEKLADEGRNIYKVGEASIFQRIYPKALSNFCLQRLYAAQMFSQKIILDFSFDEYMSPISIKECAHQVHNCFLENMNHLAPFGMSVCNFNPNSALGKTLLKFYPNFANLSTHPWDFYKQNYTSIYPSEKLVYLSPHVRQDLLQWDHDSIYIIGAFVDKTKNDPVSRVKAMEEKIKTARLPIDLYVKWKLGTKSLPLNTVLSILLEMRVHNNWNIAFKKLPSRKVKAFYAEAFTETDM